MLPKKLQDKLEARKANNALRQLGIQSSLVDFSSNDYLGFSKSKTIFNNTHKFLKGHDITNNGATGSRLLSGNHALYHLVEQQLCKFHNSESALIFNSGYDANIGFFSSVPQRGDVILYDEYIHASIRDGISMSNAKAYKFKHNDLDDLEKKCQTERSRSPKETIIYIVTESVFSMDGDSPDLKKLSQINNKHKAHLVVDEAHAIGVFGERGTGIIQDLKLEKEVFARIITFGKAMGCHGAAILGSKKLKQYLVNFSRSFIYTTALPPHSLATINTAYNTLQDTKNITKLRNNINHFKAEIKRNKLETIFIASNSAIHCCIISGNDKVKSISEKLQNSGFDVKPILSPTVPEGQERLRFCLHSFNSENNISNVLQQLATLINI
ncbi:pyridoxal phosphate-dependent aminotransferase family protein [uncultured Algibacter sp.]|uniref:aminotransferase class I/II-fold pyridoxal phosphate-dependent enzyme n=1 Tax=uncultured Algibacter sp. TaxID=298659 RepID=UPI00262A6ADC|nr:pyridoxal phosphate-dependent aminotransferase family protein [uncultured Algibacter sp.]